MMEMLAVLAVIAILSLMAIPSLQEKLVRDQITEALPLADIAKSAVALLWTTTQAFPPNNEGAGLPNADKIVSNFVSSVQVQGGAIHLTLGNNVNATLKGKVLSLRPAVVADTPIVPIAWVCGNANVPDKMTAMGENRTSIPQTLLPLRCRP
jgi:type IV pilus assembly protein PilA